MEDCLESGLLAVTFDFFLPRLALPDRVELEPAGDWRASFKDDVASLPDESCDVSC